MGTRQCEFQGCERPHMAKGLCGTHYMQQYGGRPLTPIGTGRRGTNPERVDPGSERACEFPGCVRVKHAYGLCGAHSAQKKRGMTLRPLREKQICSFPDCGRPVKSTGLCAPHSTQRAKRKPLKPIRTERAHRVVTQGYVKVWAPDHPNAQKAGWLLEHLKVMSEHLGRPIRISEGENVHHRNGIRDDNRLENLELWVSSQPSGQRVVDLLAWADWIIATYGPEREVLSTQ